MYIYGNKFLNSFCNMRTNKKTRLMARFRFSIR